MPATLTPAAPSFAEIINPSYPGTRQAVRFTWQDAMEMVRLGIIPEDASLELLDGQIVKVDRGSTCKSTGKEEKVTGNEHVICTEKLSDLRGRINSPARHVRSQQPLLCGERYAPIPDLMILRGTLADYARPPTAEDVFCVIEVADSSYERDAGEKLAAYAHAGVGQYVIVDLRNRQAEVHDTPDTDTGQYVNRQIVGSEGTVRLSAGTESPAVEVALADILP